MSKSIKYFNVLGTIIINKEKIEFSKVVRATSETEATEKIYLHYGSKHAIGRQVIKVTSVKETKEVDDPIGQELSQSESFKYIRG